MHLCLKNENSTINAFFFKRTTFWSLNTLDKVKEESDNDNHITEKIKSSVSTELDPLKWWWIECDT